MNMKTKRILAGLITGTLLLTAVGCSNGETSQTSNLDPDASYPLQTEETLSIWASVGLGSVKYATSNDLPYTQELEKLTGVNVEFVHPPQGQEAEKLKIMLAGGDATDIIFYNWTGYPGGVEKAMKEGHIAPLNDLMETYAKDFKAIVEQYPDAAKLAKTNDGTYFMFPQIRESDSMNINYGPFIRQDWLDELGLDVPDTLDDWYTVLKAFKEKKGATTPLIVSYSLFHNSGFMFGANGVTTDFYVDNGKVKYGPLEEGYKKTLEYLNKLYSEGLIAESITGVTSTDQNSMLLNSEAGAALGYLNSSIRTLQNNSAVANTSFKLKAVKYPTLNKGETPQISLIGDPAFAGYSISSTSKKKELAAKFINFNYTEAGQRLANYGIEGVSYEMKDGVPTYTDTVMKNEEGLSTSQALSIYANCGAPSSYFYEENAYMQINETEQLKDAIATWSNTNGKEHKMPTVAIPEDLSSEYASIYTDISTYVENMFYKFVMGMESLDNYDAFVAQLKQMNIDRVIEIEQEAYDLFQNR